MFDFGLYLFHNARAALDAGSGPYFYLPKLESRHEAALWSDVFAFAEERLGLERGTIKATVLIETLPAAFEMDEILYALRDNIVGLNCGRWDYIFSYIKRLGRSPDRLTPDRSAMTMDKAFLAAYSLRLIATCHRRGAFAMGGMSAFIPVKGDEAANQAALDKVRADKLREVGNGHDGTWVAHPALVPVALEAFAAMDGPNQLSKIPDRIPGRDEMLELHTGPRTEAGARENIRVAVQYHRRLARRARRGAALQSDGRRRDRRNLPRPAVAMAASSKRRSTTAAASRRDLFEDWLADELAALGDLPNLKPAARLLARAGHRRRVRGIPDAAGLRTAGLSASLRLHGSTARQVVIKVDAPLADPALQRRRQSAC